jgi:hypothetical protein
MKSHRPVSADRSHPPVRARTQATTIRSAFSTDGGLRWELERGVRVGGAAAAAHAGRPVGDGCVDEGEDNPDDAVGGTVNYGSACCVYLPDGQCRYVSVCADAV